MALARTQYVRSGDADIAYQVIGQGERDIVLVLEYEVLRIGLQTRCGLHAGEVTKRAEDVAGIAVHIGARVSALAAPGEVLATRTVRDLVAGSSISFEERGEHVLKGVPDRWALYAAVG